MYEVKSKGFTNYRPHEGIIQKSGPFSGEIMREIATALHDESVNHSLYKDLKCELLNNQSRQKKLNLCFTSAGKEGFVSRNDYTSERRRYFSLSGVKKTLSLQKESFTRSCSQ